MLSRNDFFFPGSVLRLETCYFLTSFHCGASVLHRDKTTGGHEAGSRTVIVFSLGSLVKTGASSRFDFAIWIRSSSSSTAMPVAGVICPSPSQRFHEALLPPSPNITIASHLPWISSRSIATAHFHSIPFPFLQGPHKVNPNLFARDGLIIAPACLFLSRTLHRDNSALLLIHMQLFILYFIYLKTLSHSDPRLVTAN